MFSKCSHVFRVATNCQDCTVNFRVQGFYTTIHDFGEASYIANVGYGDACFFNCVHGTTGRNNFNTVFVQETSQFYNASFIGNAQ